MKPRLALHLGWLHTDMPIYQGREGGCIAVMEKMVYGAQAWFLGEQNEISCSYISRDASRAPCNKLGRCVADVTFNFDVYVHSDIASK